jgi:hypothetical protein
MTTFDERERAFESKFALDQELQFRAVMRRNRLLAEWAGGLLGRDAISTAAYVQDLVRADLQENGDDDVLRKLSSDLDGRATPEEIQARMAELLHVARREVEESYDPANRDEPSGG